jgi:nucleotide-binding universal stress UspA family protein
VQEKWKMKRTKCVLLASHGTDGARAAERMAMELCDSMGKLHHLVVVPDLWKGMTGDDWLNNGSTRDRFRRYLESELEEEVRGNVDRVKSDAATQQISYTAEVMVGKPDACLIEASQRGKYDLVVMGSPRPKGKPGLRSRMATDPLARQLAAPLLIVPYPDA